MNQLPLVDSSACCDSANALVAGKLNPQQALARTSIWRALIRFASRDMSETYPGLLADRKQKKFACSLKARRAAQRAAGLELHLAKLDPFPDVTTVCGCGNSCQRGIWHLLYRRISLAEWTA